MNDHARRITVVGAGVIGLSIAHRLAADGHRVTVIADRTGAESVSGVAGAVWFPHLIDSSDATIRQIRAARERFERLAADPETGVMVRLGTLVERHGDVDHAWLAAVDDYELVPAAELPQGATGAVRGRLPVVDMGRYLPWLMRECRSREVRFVAAVVTDLDELAGSADAVVVAAGLRSPELLGDDETVYPVRGQVVRLQNPGLTDWLIDDDHPDGMLYVIPRIDDIVVGGTSDRDQADLTCDPDTEAAILARAVRVVPELDGLPIVSRGVGLRPARPALRVENVSGWAVPVVACYGHGGAGVTTSWGSADAVADLVRLART